MDKRDDLQSIGSASDMMKPISHGGSGAVNSLYGRQDVSSGIEHFGMQGIETSALPCPELYGRDVEKQMIIEELLEDELGAKNYKVITIVGLEGIGKTALAQCVYGDDKVVSHFNFRTWVCLSCVFDVKRIIAQLIEMATDGNATSRDLNQPQESIEGLLRGERFLIVFDDVFSNYDDWNLLKTFLPQVSYGSRIIITTRSRTLADLIKTNSTRSSCITLSGLSDDSSWFLLQKHTNEDVQRIVPEMQNVVKMCRGLPLALRTLAGLLSSKDKSEWPMIVMRLQSGKNDIMTSLRLGYHLLEPQVKRMFAYCSIFPKDFIIEENKLILMWMAEGFLLDDDSMEMEDIGHRYFLDLVSRSFFYPSPSAEGHFTMPNLTHNLAQWAAGESCCLMDYVKVSSRTRHISFTENARDETFGSLAMNPEAIEKVRTFASFVRDSGSSRVAVLDLTPRFFYLRVLSFARLKIRALPNSICQLAHLRYADFSYSEIRELPRSIGRLLNLQTLFLENCEELQSLAESTFTLSRLRHLDISGNSLQQMPLGLGELSNLRTLNGFVLEAGRGWAIGELKKMKYLRLLCVSGMEHVLSIDDALEANLYGKTSLLELRLDWGSFVNEVDDKTERNVLDQLRPSVSIKKCRLDGYRGLTFPAWVGDPCFTNLFQLYLVGSEKLECLPPLGLLPSLKELWVEGMHGIQQVGSEFYGPLSPSNPFPALRTLTFRRMNSWTMWSHSSDDNNWAFPRVEELSIKYCPLLVGSLPPHLPCVKKLELSHCENLEPLEIHNASLTRINIKSCPKLPSEVLSKNLTSLCI